MALIQQDPVLEIAENLGKILIAQFPAIKSAARGWPDRKWKPVDGSLPMVRFVEVSRKGKAAVSRYDLHGEIINPDGSGHTLQEKLRLEILLQIALFANTKEDRDTIGWQIEQFLIANPYQVLTDYTADPPVLTGEWMMLYYRGDAQDIEGEANFWARHLTFEVQSRVLDATPGWQVLKTTDTVTTA